MSDWANLLEETDSVIAKEVDKIQIGVDSNKTAESAPAPPPAAAAAANPTVTPAAHPVAEAQAGDAAEDPGMCVCVFLCV